MKNLPKIFAWATVVFLILSVILGSAIDGLLGGIFLGNSILCFIFALIFGTIKEKNK